MHHTELNPRDQLAFTAGRARQAVRQHLSLARRERESATYCRWHVYEARKALHDYLRAMREIEQLEFRLPHIAPITVRPVDAEKMVRLAVERLQMGAI
jgi:hypothetical protein